MAKQKQFIIYFKWWRKSVCIWIITFCIWFTEFNSELSGWQNRAVDISNLHIHHLKKILLTIFFIIIPNLLTIYTTTSRVIPFTLPEITTSWLVMADMAKYKYNKYFFCTRLSCNLSCKCFYKCLNNISSSITFFCFLCFILKF